MMLAVFYFKPSSLLLPLALAKVTETDIIKMFTHIFEVTFNRTQFKGHTMF